MVNNDRLRISRIYDTVMKQARLENLEVPSRVLLVDESQNLNECQVAWMTEQRRLGGGKQMYFVGDAVHTI